jgi:hypothetical protein
VVGIISSIFPTSLSPTSGKSTEILPRVGRGAGENIFPTDNGQRTTDNHQKYTSFFHSLIAQSIVKLGLPLNHAGFCSQNSCGDG